MCTEPIFSLTETPILALVRGFHNTQNLSLYICSLIVVFSLLGLDLVVLLLCPAAGAWSVNMDLGLLELKSIYGDRRLALSLREAETKPRAAGEHSCPPTVVCNV